MEEFNIDQEFIENILSMLISKDTCDHTLALSILNSVIININIYKQFKNIYYDNQLLDTYVDIQLLDTYVYNKMRMMTYFTLKWGLEKWLRKQN